MAKPAVFFLCLFLLLVLLCGLVQSAKLSKRTHTVSKRVTLPTKCCLPLNNAVQSLSYRTRITVEHPYYPDEANETSVAKSIERIAYATNGERTLIVLDDGSADVTTYNGFNYTCDCYTSVSYTIPPGESCYTYKFPSEFPTPRVPGCIISLYDARLVSFQNGVTTVEVPGLKSPSVLELKLLDDGCIPIKFEHPPSVFTSDYSTTTYYTLSEFEPIENDSRLDELLSIDLSQLELCKTID